MALWCGSPRGYLPGFKSHQKRCNPRVLLCLHACGQYSPGCWPPSLLITLPFSPTPCPLQSVADLAGAAEQLPLEVPLGQEFVFHSIFACPVSRDQVGGREGGVGGGWGGLGSVVP